MKLSGTNVLVTGADGFIGSHLVERLLMEGVNIRASVVILKQLTREICKGLQPNPLPFLMIFMPVSHFHGAMVEALEY